MGDSENPQVTQVLEALSAGDQVAAEKLLPMVYAELRGLAAARMAKTPPGNTLQPTALVHEAYLRVVGKHDSKWAGRSHFFKAAARAMRDILVEQTRRKASLKRGGDRKRIDNEHVEPEFETPSEDLLALDEALRRLEAEDSRYGQIVNLRYFVGLTAAETAAVIGVSVRTISTQWQYIRRRLFRELSSDV